MDTIDVTYPVFEANQVLTNAHLNELFEYLDEQDRLTRANLIGIGIACGLEVEFEAPGTVHLSKGCGVTSEGYLIVEPEDLELITVRPYQLPIEYGYPPFVDSGPPVEQYHLWELFDDEDVPGGEPLDTSGLVLEEMAVVLFLELRKDGLRNCSPNNCDDRGAEVTATVRRLLIDVADLHAVITATSGAADFLGADLTERLDLPDLRMPRVDVPNRGLVAPEEVLFAFQFAFRQNGLVEATFDALTELHSAFEPLVHDEFPADPFAGFKDQFAFLDGDPATTAQVRFMPYYWDLFDDLLAAYDELRWKGVDLMCACCPPAGLFPRHLMAGVLDSTAFDVADYRHHFIPSPAVGDCEDRTREVRQLFRRLVAMLESFTETPPDKGVRVTPSRWGDAPVSAKAIPYYYAQDGAPPVFELWDPVKTARHRGNQNLSYRADEYAPAQPPFVTDPLRFDLEPNNFLRVEGHLGKNVGHVLETLLSLKKSHRLPIEVIALRTGGLDENVDVDLRKEQCRFQDLETLYEALKSELICFLVKQVQYFYSLPDEDVAGEEPAVPTLALLRKYAPDFVAEPGTLGRKIEIALTWHHGQPVLFVFGLPSQVFALVGAMSALSSQLPDDIRQLDLEVFRDRYQRIVEIARQIEEFRRQGEFDAPGLSDRLDDIVFRCRLDPFEALAEEYKRRVLEVKHAQFLSHFLECHPGIQHKAGVPLGGTFILVYHQLPEPTRSTRAAVAPAVAAGFDEFSLRSSAAAVDDVEDSATRNVASRGQTYDFDERQVEQLDDALGRFRYKAELAEDPDLQVVYMILTGKLLIPEFTVSRVTDETYQDAIAHLADGTVIADFFLPYVCCSDCPPIQYTLPSARLGVTTSTTCTNTDGFAEVTLTAEGASGALSVQVDGGAFEEVTGPLLLAVGEHSIVVRDATGNESSPVDITIPPQLVMGPAETDVDQAAGTYRVAFTVEGGTPPYVADPGTIVDSTYTSPVLPVDQVLTVVVKDAVGCTVEGRFESGVEPCDFPCDGAAIRQGFRFWLPEARPNLPINEYRAEVRSFRVMDPAGNPIDLTAEVNDVVNQAPHPIRTAGYRDLVQRWIDNINDLVAGRIGSDQWFRLEYEPAPETGTTGTLFVERLVCIDFDFDLAVAFVQGQRERLLQLGYNSRGTVFVETGAADTKFRIPPFGVSTSNKCRPDEPPVPECEGTDLELVIRREGVFPDTVELTAVASGTDSPAAFLWEVQDGIPSTAAGERIRLGFDPPEPVEKLVRLTAFTEKGCTVTVEEVIDIFKPVG
jgi:hypothetical protein